MRRWQRSFRGEWLVGAERIRACWLPLPLLTALNDPTSLRLVDERSLDSPHIKAQLLLQAHFARMPLPMSDYVTDTKSVLDQALRVLQAMVDVAADGGWLYTTLGTMRLSQMVTQARWLDDPGLTDLPYIDAAAAKRLNGRGVKSWLQLMAAPQDQLREWLKGSGMCGRDVSDLASTLCTLPRVRLTAAPKDGDNSPFAPGADGTVAVTLKAENERSRGMAYAPRFPKPKLASWWLVMGDGDEVRTILVSPVPCSLPRAAICCPCLPRR